MSQLAPALRRITKSATHPSSLLYNVQLESSRKKYLGLKLLENGKEDMLELGAPGKDVRESSIVERMEEERGSALEIVERQAHWQCEQFLFTKEATN